jgi:hypothetical protein
MAVIVMVVVVVIMMRMFVCVVMIMLVIVMGMFVLVVMTVIVLVVIGEMNVEFYAGNSGFFLAGDVEVITIDAQFLQFVFELMRVHAEVQQRAEKHIAADAAEDIKVESFHLSISALICAAA